MGIFANWPFRRAVQVVDAPAPAPAPPAPDTETGSQARDLIGDASDLFVGSPYPNGNNCNNPCGFPGYGGLYAGTYQTYRWMRKHAIIAQARSQFLSPLIAAPFGYEDVRVPKVTGPLSKRGQKRKQEPSPELEFVKQQIEPMRLGLVKDAVCAGTDYGWAPFEKVWDVQGGRYVLADLKPLRVDTTTICAAKDGSFAGLLPDNKTQVAERLSPVKCWLWTYDGEFRDPYGESQLERVRETAWVPWLDCVTQLYRLARKIAGIMPIVYTPPGTFRTPAGETKSWRDVARNILQAALQGIGVHITTVGTQTPTAGVANFEQIIELMKVAGVRLEVQDFGSNAPALGSLLEQMAGWEQKMFAGYFQSPRTGMATQGGTKADAEQHTDTATTPAENVSAFVTDALNRGVVDDILALNYGEQARGRVRITPAKLTDDNLGTDTAAIAALHADPDLGPQFREQVDYNEICDRRGIPHANPIKLERIEMDDGEDAGTIGGEDDDEAD